MATGTATKVNPSAKAKPGTPDAAAKKEYKKKPAHPHVGAADSSVYPFPAPAVTSDDDWSSGAPADFSPSNFAPLKKVDFEQEWQYYQHRIELLKSKIDDAEMLRDEAKTLGGAKDRAAAKRMSTMAKKIAEIQSKLAADDVDVASILKNAGVDLGALEGLVAAAKV